MFALDVLIVRTSASCAGFKSGPLQTKYVKLIILNKNGKRRRRERRKMTRRRRKRRKRRKKEEKEEEEGGEGEGEKKNVTTI